MFVMVSLPTTSSSSLTSHHAVITVARGLDPFQLLSRDHVSSGHLFFVLAEQVEALEALLGRMHNRGSYEKRGSIPLVTSLHSFCSRGASPACNTVLTAQNKARDRQPINVTVIHFIYPAVSQNM